VGGLVDESARDAAHPASWNPPEHTGELWPSVLDVLARPSPHFPNLSAGTQVHPSFASSSRHKQIEVPGAAASPHGAVIVLLYFLSSVYLAASQVRSEQTRTPFRDLCETPLIFSRAVWQIHGSCCGTGKYPRGLGDERKYQVIV